MIIIKDSNGNIVDARIRYDKSDLDAIKEETNEFAEYIIKLKNIIHKAI